MHFILTPSLPRFGTYASGSGTSDLRFNYIVMPGDSSYNLDINPNATIELLSSADNILYHSATPTLQANLNTRGSNFISAKNLVVDTTAPTVDQTIGVVAFNTIDGTYTVGDTLYFTLKVRHHEDKSQRGANRLAGSSVFDVTI